MHRRLNKFWKKLKFAILMFKHYDRFGQFILISTEYNSVGNERPSEIDAFMVARFRNTLLDRNTGNIVQRPMRVWG